jgi:hypothetical protein
VDFTDKMKTEYKPEGGDAVFANIASLQPHDGEPWKIYRRVLIMQGYLVGSFKGSINKNLLGTIYLGQRKTGQKPPYMFKSLKDNPQAVEQATAWMRLHEEEFLATPEPSFEEPEAGKKSTLDSMRDASNPWMDAQEPPF